LGEGANARDDHSDSVFFILNFLGYADDHV
jgi:hypothetical protein